MSKYITLKNNLKVQLHLDKTKNSYHLYATAGSYKKVGFCTFTLTYKYIKPLTDQERLDYANKHNIPFEKAPTMRKKKATNPKTFLIDGDYIVVKNGRYKIVETICYLDKIEILDSNYFKVGLGSYLLKAMEIIIAKHNCSYIEGVFAPFGRFQSGAEIFYDRHDFEIIEDPELHGIKHIYKKCTQKTLNHGV